MIMLSPGVYAREIDASLYAPQISTTVFAVIGTASKGPVDEATLFTDEGSLIAAHGQPSATHIALYSAIQYLRKGSQLYFVRIASYDLTASCEIMNAAGTDVALTIEAVSSGSWGNSVSVLVTAGTKAGTYKISVLDGGVAVETYDLLRVGAAYASNSNYVTTRINGVSDYITITPDETESDLATSSTATSLAGGDDGSTVEDDDVIGSVGTPPTVPATGMKIFANPDITAINILAVPGNSHRAVISAMIDLCETRGDCLCLIDPPYGKTVQGVVDWSNGEGEDLYDPTATINSSYAAIFYPWVQVYDGYSNADVWVPPCGLVAAVMAYTDRIAEPWFAPAGFQRGSLASVLALEHSPTQGERDYMYGSGNVVNPIVNFSGQGIVVWGQRTTARASTKLDRINVRRLMNYVKKSVTVAALQLVHEPNDEITWERFRDLVDPYLSYIKSRRGIEDFRVICDETTNPLAVRNRKQMVGKILLAPTDAAEMIEVPFVIVNNVAQFTEVEVA